VESHEADKLARLAGVARGLRASLADPGTDAIRREVDLYAYDEVLVTLADLVELEVPGAVRDEMGPGDRADLEAALATAGIDLVGGQEPGPASAASGAGS